jgi:hypothetical protein
MTLERYTRLCIHNAIANERRKAKHVVPWTTLGLDMQKPGKGKRTEIRIDAAIPQSRPDVEPAQAQRGIRLWLLLAELSGEPLTFESAKAYFKGEPLVGSPKAFGHAMKKLGYTSRRVKRGGKLVTVYEPCEAGLIFKLAAEPIVATGGALYTDLRSSDVHRLAAS